MDRYLGGGLIPSIPFIVHKYNYTDDGQMWGECTPYFDYVEPIGT